jgi:hypothetical protein
VARSLSGLGADHAASASSGAITRFPRRHQALLKQWR